MAENKKKEPPMSNDAQISLWKAQVAETAELYDEMCDYVEEALTKNRNVLDTHGRNLFAIAFKNGFGSFRTQYRQLDGYKVSNTKDQEEQNACNLAQKELKKKLVSKLEEKAGKIINLLEALIQNIPKEYDPKDEMRISYNKMLGDYNRYRAEYLEDKQDVVNAASEAYEEAKGLAESNLPSTDPTRLGLMLNISVFYYEVANKKSDATNLAKKAFDEAIEKLDSLDNDKYKDSTLIMQLLRDNLSLWTADAEEKGDEPKD